ncbi:MAG: iron-containing redox enzyme family protein [Elainella sp. C42_A2020_010]|nr:iron-containing redox enzyme family protein [Elainella sp. C42_A2020_010]RNJ65730.1 MAG: iron-containing redox enzyme family protein [Leptolyngbya sp. IPPAS B-1204]
MITSRLSKSWQDAFLGSSRLKSSSKSSAQTSPLSYDEAEQQFIQFLTTEDLDRQVLTQPSLTEAFEATLEQALALAYADQTHDQNQLPEAENRFLQRILYRINRLNFVWYGDLSQYTNERSVYLQWVRDRIEMVWQAWETAQFDLEQLQQIDVKQALTERASVDLDPPLSSGKRYIREQMTQAGYRHLIAIASLDGLVESSRLCHILGGASNEVQATLIRVLLEEYGNGRLSRKHSTFFAQMMQELDLNPDPEAYFDWVPWQVLASINHNFLLTQRKRHFLRYVGGFTYFEIVGPSIYKDYMAAASRLGLSDTAMGYWELHIREDERHGQWMLEQVSLPLVELYPNEAWELVLGYDQEKYMGDRAGAAVIAAIQAAETAVASERHS